MNLMPGEGRDDRTADEILNGQKGGEVGTPSDYSDIPDPDYEGVDPQLFQYMEAVDSFHRYEARNRLRDSDI